MQEVDCQQGVYDCLYDGLDGTGAEECAEYNNHYEELQGEVWVVIVAALTMAAMGLAIGGNDVANAWGTSVGSKAIKVQHALVIAAISNVMGATLLGAGVADKLQHGVSALDSPECFACGFCDSKMSLYGLGMLSALFAAAVFLFLATVKKLPVSTTHAIVGGVVGMTVGATRDISNGISGVFHGTQCVDWSLSGFGGMVISWVLSPVLAGVMSCVLYRTSYHLIYKGIVSANFSSNPAGSKDSNTSANISVSKELNDSRDIPPDGPTERTLTLLPFCYAGMMWTMVYLICSKSTATKSISLEKQLIFASLLAGGCFLIAHFGVIPHIRQELQQRQSSHLSNELTSTTTVTTLALELSTHSDTSTSLDRSFNPLVESSSVEYKTPTPTSLEDVNSNTTKIEEFSAKDVSFCFQYLLVCVAALESFAHGANDTANSTAAFSAVIHVYENGLNVCSSELHTPMWVMALGGSFVGVGVLFFGRGVIETIGHKLTGDLDCHKGFCIEFSSCMAVVFVSSLGLPVSTTHCQVGAVVAIGIQSTGVSSVDWLMVREIVFSWVLTVPFAALLAAGILNALKVLS